MHTAEEDYLKLIYELSQECEHEFLKSAIIAEKFDYTMQSVNEMIKRMAKKELVEFVPYKGIKLTKKGKEEALRMIRSHRVWEVFLAEKLGLSWEALHEEAEKLEHVTSELVLERLYDYLDQPKYCMHGNPIPNKDGIIAKKADISLWDTKAGFSFKVTRVKDNKALLHYLNQIPLALNDNIFIHQKDEFGGIVYIMKDNNSHAITKKIALTIFGKHQD